MTALGHPGLMPDISPPVWPSVPQIEGKTLDLEALCPLSLVRTHTKTDDVPHVTDEQLVLYRQTAFEAAEKYTGMLFTQQKAVTEDVSCKPGRKWRDSYKYRLRYPASDGLVYLYGAKHGLGNKIFNLEPGARVIRIPVVQGALDLSPCCDPCSSGRAVNFGMKVLYRAGISCKEEVPSGIIVGVLKFIAWMVMNAGDEILTVRNREASDSSGIIGTNNGAWASGAIEQWRIYVDDAI